MLLDLTTATETRLSMLNLPGQITGLIFNPDGSLLTASASYEDPGPYANTIQHGQMAVWDTASGQLIAHADLRGSTAGDPAFSEDGRFLEYLIQEGNEYPFQIWTLGLDQWQAIACRIANRNLTESEWQRYVIGEDYRLICP
jgi:WD40 repeat protein